MNADIHIRPARPDDALKLSILYKTVYIHTYGFEGVSDEYANFIEEQFSPAFLESKIKKAEGFQLVADFKNNLVGVTEICYDKQNPIDGSIIPELSKLYILEAFSRQKIGSRLISEAEKIIQNEGHSAYWLCVWALNPKAISFYEKMSFESQGTVPFQMETNCYENMVMTKTLRP
jgi:ribosomal protein S18 acetylase RimI-like enzyme